MTGAAGPRGAARRDALLEAVLQIVAEIGPDAVTHRRVAEVAGLPLASTTYWFASKKELLAAALELAAERDIIRLRSAARRPNRRGSIEAIIALIVEPIGERLHTTRGSVIANYALWLEAARRPSWQATAQRWTDAYHDTVSELLVRAGSRDPEGDAHLLVAAADGLLMEQLSGGGASDPLPLLRRLAAALLTSR